MELEFRSRNNDMGPVFPTFQERVNTMLPADNIASAASSPSRSFLSESAAPVLETQKPATPRMLNSQEMQQAIALVEQEAEQHTQELLRAHSGLNEQRVERLLGLLN
ncbi:MAG: pseudouridine synthase [Desulfovibrio sp.]|nr:pseudouridine synthase [Desulfovibrio sp.]